MGLHGAWSYGLKLDSQLRTFSQMEEVREEETKRHERESMNLASHKHTKMKHSLEQMHILMHNT